MYGICYHEPKWVLLLSVFSFLSPFSRTSPNPRKRHYCHRTIWGPFIYVVMYSVLHSSTFIIMIIFLKPSFPGPKWFHILHCTLHWARYSTFTLNTCLVQGSLSPRIFEHWKNHMRIVLIRCVHQHDYYGTQIYYTYWHVMYIFYIAFVHICNPPFSSL